MPSAWKLSNVCIISKGGDHSIPSNYRPVSLLHTMENVLEKIIACCASKTSLLTKLPVGIVKENYKLLHQTNFYRMVSPFGAFY